MDITNLYEYDVIVSGKPEQPFIKFKKYYTATGVDYKFDKKFYRFYSPVFNTSMTKAAIHKSLASMLDNLDKHIKAEVEKELVLIKEKLINEKKEHYQFNRLKAKLDSLEAS